MLKDLVFQIKEEIDSIQLQSKQYSKDLPQKKKELQELNDEIDKRKEILSQLTMSKAKLDADLIGIENKIEKQSNDFKEKIEQTLQNTDLEVIKRKKDVISREETIQVSEKEIKSLREAINKDSASLQAKIKENTLKSKELTKKENMVNELEKLTKERDSILSYKESILNQGIEKNEAIKIKLDEQIRDVGSKEKKLDSLLDQANDQLFKINKSKRDSEIKDKTLNERLAILKQTEDKLRKKELWLEDRERTIDFNTKK